MRAYLDTHEGAIISAYAFSLRASRTLLLFAQKVLEQCLQLVYLRRQLPELVHLRRQLPELLGCLRPAVGRLRNVGSRDAPQAAAIAFRDSPAWIEDARLDSGVKDDARAEKHTYARECGGSRCRAPMEQSRVHSRVEHSLAPRVSLVAVLRRIGLRVALAHQALALGRGGDSGVSDEAALRQAGVDHAGVVYAECLWMSSIRHESQF